jgi:murein DD-endopeptidase MepM/ murein hydrolase activator NlpD
VETLRAAKAALEAQSGAFSSVLGALEEKLHNLNGLRSERSALTAEIRVQLGLPLETPDDEVLPRLAAAVAWAAPLGVGGDPESPESGSRNVIRNMNLDLERLLTLADRTESDLALINEALAGSGSILAATPAVMPLGQAPISSRFGPRLSPFGGRSADYHRGLDIPAPIGTEVRAPADGTVLAVGNAGDGYGLLMTIDHGYGLVTRYAHLSGTLVEAGQTVHRGEPVARVGNSGRSTGPHLHYEVLLGGVPANPMEILAAVAPAIFQEIKHVNDFAGRALQYTGGASEPEP